MTERSMRQKWLNKEISNGEYRNYLAKKEGYNSYADQQRALIQKRGYSGFQECFNRQATKHGFKDEAEYCRHLDHVSGRSKPYDENTDCAYYLGVHITEYAIFNSLNNALKMPIKNSGHDILCNKEHKLDAKSACLRKNGDWHFHINNNQKADFFVLAAFDNREELNLMYVWLIHRNEVLNILQTPKRIKDIKDFSIRNSKKQLDYYSKYIWHEKFDEIKKYVDIIKNQKSTCPKQE